MKETFESLTQRFFYLSIPGHLISSFMAKFAHDICLQQLICISNLQKVRIYESDLDIFYDLSTKVKLHRHGK